MATKAPNIIRRPPSITRMPPTTIAKLRSITRRARQRRAHITPMLRTVTPHMLGIMPMKLPSITLTNTAVPKSRQARSQMIGPAGAIRAGLLLHSGF